MKAEEILNTYTPNREYNSYYHEIFIIEAMQEYARIQIEKDRERITNLILSSQWQNDELEKLPIILD